jgi:hypothetical protein
MALRLSSMAAAAPTEGAVLRVFCYSVFENRERRIAMVLKPKDIYAQMMLEKVVADGEPPPVWPYPENEVSGIGFSPLHKSAPVAAKQDAAFCDLLALVDVVRAGRALEKAFAGKELQQRLKIHGDTKPQH